TGREAARGCGRLRGPGRAGPGAHHRLRPGAHLGRRTLPGAAGGGRAVPALAELSGRGNHRLRPAGLADRPSAAGNERIDHRRSWPGGPGPRPGCPSASSARRGRPAAARPAGDRPGLVRRRPAQRRRVRRGAGVHGDPAYPGRLPARSREAEHRHCGSSEPPWIAICPALHRAAARGHGAANAPPGRTASMSFIAPAAAFLAVTLPAILALYFLRIRRPTRVIPALHLWPDQIRDRQANVPWQRLRPSWLLFLQLLAAAVLVGAAVQPALPVGATLAHHTIVLLDTSAAMQARDVASSRLEQAKKEVGSLVDELGASDRMTIIRVGAVPEIAASAIGDRDLLHRALDATQASNGAGDISSALNLAGGLVRPGEDARALLYSGGILLPIRSSFGEGLPFPLEYHKVGVSGANIAITELNVRTNAQVRAAFLRVQNFGQQSRQVSLEWRADGRLVDARPLTLAARQAQDLILAVPADA